MRFVERYASPIYSFRETDLHKSLIFLPMRAVTWDAMLFGYLAKMYSRQKNGKMGVSRYEVNIRFTFKTSDPNVPTIKATFALSKTRPLLVFSPVSVLERSSSVSNIAVIRFPITIFLVAPAQAIFILSSEENVISLSYNKDFRKIYWNQ